MEEDSSSSESDEDFDEEEDEEDSSCGETQPESSGWFVKHLDDSVSDIRWSVGPEDGSGGVEDDEGGCRDWAPGSTFGALIGEHEVLSLIVDSCGIPYSDPNRTRTVLLGPSWGADALRLLRADPNAVEEEFAVAVLPWAITVADEWIGWPLRIGITRWGIWFPEGNINAGCLLATKAAGPNVEARPQERILVVMPLKNRPLSFQANRNWAGFNCSR